MTYLWRIVSLLMILCVQSESIYDEGDDEEESEEEDLEAEDGGLEDLEGDDSGDVEEDEEVSGQHSLQPPLFSFHGWMVTLFSLFYQDASARKKQKQ